MHLLHLSTSVRQVRMLLSGNSFLLFSRSLRGVGQHLVASAVPYQASGHHDSFLHESTRLSLGSRSSLLTSGIKCLGFTNLQSSRRFSTSLAVFTNDGESPDKAPGFFLGHPSEVRSLHFTLEHKKKEFQCDDCELEFVTKRGLNRHRHAIHLRTFPCTHVNCDKAFATIDALKRHEFVHTDVRPFSCKLCPLTFKLNYDLGIHVRNMHANKMPYICRHCEFSFATKEHFLKHSCSEAKVVSLEEVMKCDKCPRVFSSKLALQAHLRKHKNEVHRVAEKSEAL